MYPQMVHRHMLVSSACLYWGNTAFDGSGPTLARQRTVEFFMIFPGALGKLLSEGIAFFVVFHAGTVEDLDAGFNDFEPHLLERLIGFFHRAAAPPEASEGSGQPVLGPEPPEVRQKLGNGREHNVV